MSNSARERILARLHSASRKAAVYAPESACLPIETLAQREKIAKLKTLMEAVRAEVHVVQSENWVDTLKDILRKRELDTLLYAPGTHIGEALEKAWAVNSERLPALTAYESDIENFKEKLFKMDAGITSTLGSISETGALILWPNEKEPRSMSLIPPIHIAVLAAEKIYNTFCEVIQTENWPDRMPTNSVLISGPSKTADIELTLAFGVHGPKELIVLILES